MQTNTVRTTVDIKENLFREIKEYSARHGLTQKEVISQAVASYLGNEIIENEADRLWDKLRKLAKTGEQDIDLIRELRSDRTR